MFFTLIVGVRSLTMRVYEYSGSTTHFFSLGSICSNPTNICFRISFRLGFAVIVKLNSIRFIQIIQQMKLFCRQILLLSCCQYSCPSSFHAPTQQTIKNTTPTKITFRLVPEGCSGTVAGSTTANTGFSS